MNNWKFFNEADDIIIDEIPYDLDIDINTKSGEVTISWEDGNTSMDEFIVFTGDNIKAATWDYGKLDIQDDNGDNYTITFYQHRALTPDNF